MSEQTCVCIDWLAWRDDMQVHVGTMLGCAPWWAYLGGVVYVALALTTLGAWLGSRR